MDEITRKKYLERYIEYIKKCDNELIYEEIKLLFSILSENNINKLFELKGIDADDLILEEKEKTTLELIEDLKTENAKIYYEIQYDYRGEENGDFYDGDGVCERIITALDCCHLLFEKKEYEKFYNIAKKLIFLEVICETIDEYNDNYSEIEFYDIEDVISRFHYKYDVQPFLSMLLSVSLMFENEIDDLIRIFKKLNLYEVNDLDKILVHIDKNDQVIEKLKQMISKLDLTLYREYNLFLSIMYYIDDNVIFRDKALEFIDIVPKLFKKYCEFAKDRGIDIKDIVLVAIDRSKDEKEKEELIKLI